LKQTLVGHRCC